jgi:hypothetical protein
VDAKPLTKTRLFYLKAPKAWMPWYVMIMLALCVGMVEVCKNKADIVVEKHVQGAEEFTTLVRRIKRLNLARNKKLKAAPAPRSTAQSFTPNAGNQRISQDFTRS